MTVQLHLGDCLEFMKSMPDGSVDAVITDPPYGVNLGDHDGARETRKGLLVKGGGYLDTPENFIEVVVPAISECLRVAKRAMVFCVPPMMWNLPAPDAMGGVFIPGAVGRNRWGWSSLIHLLLYGTAPDLHLGAKPTAKEGTAIAEKTGHPTTKPLAWMRWCVELGSRQGDTIFDPFMGSGTTGVACVQTGRNFIGCEISKDYYDIAAKRIADAQLQERMPI